MSVGVDTPDLEALEALVEAFSGEDPTEVSGLRLDGELERLARVVGRLEAVLVRRTGAWERSGAWAHDGSKSAAAALARRTGVAAGTARERLRVARRLESAPATVAAYLDGRLSLAKVRLLTSLVAEDRTDTLREAFARAEADLVKAAERVSVRQCAWVVRHFFAAADPEGFEADCEKDYRRNRFDVAQSFEGTGHIDGFLDAESTAIVRHALGAMEDRIYRATTAHNDDGDDGEGDGAKLTPAQRRAEAFVAICASVIGDDPDRDHTTTGVARPLITALLDLADTPGPDPVLDLTADDDPVLDLTADDGDHADETAGGEDPVGAGGCGTGRGGPGPAAVLAESNQPLPRSFQQRLLCDAAFIRVLTRGGTMPLDVGRASRNPTTAIVRALVCRDGGCAFPGCETPARFCEAHHIHHWEHGEPTALANLVLLLCRHHHRLLHNSPWTVHIPPDTGQPTFTDPRGTTHRANAPPHHHARTARRIAHRHRQPVG